MITGLTRKTSDGEIAGSFDFSRDTVVDYTSPGSGGLAPIENLLLPGAPIEVLTAEMGQSGHLEFEPTDPEDYATDPDKRYRVLTYSGSVTIPDGSSGSGPTKVWYARTTTDNRVMTYHLDYAEDPVGWIFTETGSRETGDQFVFYTGEDEPAIVDVGGPVTSPTTYTEEASVYAGAGITATLTSLVTAAYLQTWCDDKLTDIKSKVDDPEESVPLGSSLISYHRGDVRIQIASVRIVHTGSGLIYPLSGNLSYFQDDMAPTFSLTAGSWSVSVSNPISQATDSYYDPAGMFGDDNWWPSGFSLFATTGDTIAGGASFPGNGIDFPLTFGRQEVRVVSLDGLKRRVTILYTVDEDVFTVDLTTSAQDGFANATDFQSTSVELIGGVSGTLVKSVLINDDDEETVEYDPLADPPIPGDADFLLKFAFLHKSRGGKLWGYTGFGSMIPEGEDSGIRYKTITISSSGLEYAAQDATTPPPGLTGLTASGEMSGTHTLTNPSEWKIGTLDAMGRWSKVDSLDNSPFKMEWSAGGHTGSYQIHISNTSLIVNPPFMGDGEEITITETEYEVTVPAPDPLPVREYRYSWPKIESNNAPDPSVINQGFTLDEPFGETTKQKSAWIDLGLPDAGKSWSSDASDEFSCFVGEV